VIIPATYNNLPVIRIGPDAFGMPSPYKSMITEVTIPNSITRIEGSAFQNCKNLTSITIPDSVTYIGPRAFLGCTNLTSVTFQCATNDLGLQSFPGDLRNKYLAGGPGTYTRPNVKSNTWTKQ